MCNCWVKQDRLYVERDTEMCSCNHCRIGKAVSITYSKRVFVVLCIWHTMRMRHIVICGLSSSTTFFPHFSHKRHDFQKEVTEHKICVFIFSTNLSETFLILRRNERDMIKNVHWSSCKVLFILVRF